ncbi:MAG: TspO/MBR family protein [Patescibacteria group bacterium]
MKKLTALGFYLFVPLLVGVLGSIFTSPAIPTWYASLNKPFFNPPSWLFAPVWTILYLMMGYAAYLVSQSKSKLKATALKYFWLQLTANFFWSLIFFGLRHPTLAFLEIIILWVLIYKTKLEFLKISKLAGYLLIPYLLWVSFATLLNLSIVLLN